MNVFDIGGRRTMVAGVAVSAASVVVPVVMGNSETSAKLDLLDGTAWLSSEAAGNVVRVNGETGLVDARLDLGELAEEVLVSQDDGVVLVRIGDQVRSIDLANLDWGAATGASAGTGLVVGDGVAYMVSPGGHVRQLDPVTLETVGEVDLGAPPAGAGVVARERLVLPTGDGAVKVVDGDELAGEVDAGSPVTRSTSAGWATRSRSSTSPSGPSGRSTRGAGSPETRRRSSCRAGSCRCPPSCPTAASG